MMTCLCFLLLTSGQISQPCCAIHTSIAKSVTGTDLNSLLTGFSVTKMPCSKSHFTCLVVVLPHGRG